jgi:hypothetical protein
VAIPRVKQMIRRKMAHLKYFDLNRFILIPPDKKIEDVRRPISDTHLEWTFNVRRNNEKLKNPSNHTNFSKSPPFLPNFYTVKKSATLIMD